jgi:DNA-binding MarR family transcriptional regulator
VAIETCPAPDPSPALPLRLVALGEAIEAELGRIGAARLGLTAAECRILAVLPDEGPTTARDAGRAAGMHKTRVSRALRLLEDKGLVTGVVNTKDLREIRIGLSDTGRILRRELDAVLRIVDAHFAAVYPRMDPAEDVDDAGEK